MPVRPSVSFFKCVQTYMRVVLNQMKNGFLSVAALSTGNRRNMKGTFHNIWVLVPKLPVT